MNRSVQIKLALTIAGLAVWVYGARNDDATVRWVGIALIALAFAVRFFKRRTGQGQGGPP